MNRLTLSVILALSLPALAACGSASSPSASAGPASTHANAGAAAKPAALVLRPSDLGAGYLIDPNATNRVTLATELEHESAAARAADRRAYAGGYTAAFEKPGVAGVVSEVLTYRDPASAAIVSRDRVGAAHVLRELHGRTVRPPAGVPGDPRLTIAGTLQGMPAHAYVWQHGSAIELVLAFGPRVTQARTAALARRQDARLTRLTA